MDTYTLDTSVIIKWFNQENESKVEIAHKIYEDMLDDKIILTAPSLLTIELVNALKKGKKMLAPAIKEIIKNLFSIPIIIKEPTQAVLEQTAEIMEIYQIAAYDALFVAAAKDSECQLISDDVKSHGKINDGSVVMLEDYKSP